MTDSRQNIENGTQVRLYHVHVCDYKIFFTAAFVLNLFMFYYYYKRLPFMTVVGRVLHCLQCLLDGAGKIGCKKAKNTDGRLFEILKWIGILLESYPAEKWFLLMARTWDITYRMTKAIVIASVSTQDSD